MKHHTKVWLKGKGLTGHEAFIPCEICRGARAVVDIHHIIPRGIGGARDKDFFENLVGCCRSCHAACESGAISREFQQQIVKERQ